MARVVRSVESFCKELNVGDVFWYVTSWFGRPYEIVGPCTITGFLMDKRFGFPVVEYTRLDAGGEIIEERSIGDLTNQYHGVFLSAADAYEYFEVRKSKCIRVF